MEGGQTRCAAAYSRRPPEQVDEGIKRLAVRASARCSAPGSGAADAAGRGRPRAIAPSRRASVFGSGARGIETFDLGRPRPAAGAAAWRAQPDRVPACAYVLICAAGTPSWPSGRLLHTSVGVRRDERRVRDRACGPGATSSAAPNGRPAGASAATICASTILAGRGGLHPRDAPGADRHRAPASACTAPAPSGETSGARRRPPTRSSVRRGPVASGVEPGPDEGRALAVHRQVQSRLHRTARLLFEQLGSAEPRRADRTDRDLRGERSTVAAFGQPLRRPTDVGPSPGGHGRPQRGRERGLGGDRLRGAEVPPARAARPGPDRPASVPRDEHVATRRDGHRHRAHPSGL